MAKTSVKARQRKREVLVAKYAEKRAALKAAGDYKAWTCFQKMHPLYVLKTVAS